MATGDFIGQDGQDEILTRDWDTDGRFHVFQRQANGSFVDTSSLTGLDFNFDLQIGQNLGVGDFNEDQAVDVVLSQTGGTGDEAQFFKGSGDGTFSAQFSRSLPGDFTVASVNPTQDSHLDLVGRGQIDFDGNSVDQFVQVALGHGDGSFTVTNIFSVPTPHSVVADVRDMNNDGKTDILLWNPSAKSLTVYNGDGTSDGFSEGSTVSIASLLDAAPESNNRHLELGFTASAPVLVGNFVGDGKVDVVIAYGDTVRDPFLQGQVHVVLYQNTNSGFVQVSDQLLLKTSTTEDFRIGINSAASTNLNGDTFDDVVFAPNNFIYQAAENPLYLLLGSSSGFTGPQKLAFQGSPNDLIVGNFDGDDSPDLALSTNVPHSGQFPLPFQDGVQTLTDIASQLNIEMSLTTADPYSRPDDEMVFTADVYMQASPELKITTGQVTFIDSYDHDNNPDTASIVTTLKTLDLDASGTAVLIIGGPNANYVGTLDLGFHKITARYSDDPNVNQPFVVQVVSSSPPYQQLDADYTVDLFGDSAFNSARPFAFGAETQFAPQLSVGPLSTLTIVVTYPEPAPPPLVVKIRFGLTNSTSQVTIDFIPDLTSFPLAGQPTPPSQPQIATQFFYTYRINASTPQGLAQVDVVGRDLEGHDRAVVNQQFQVTDVMGGLSGSPIPLLINGNSAPLIGDLSATVDPGTTYGYDVKPLVYGTDGDRNVMIYEIGRLENSILVNSFGTQVFSDRNTAANARLRLEFTPSSAQAGKDLIARFGCLDLTTGVSSTMTIRFHVTGSEPSQPITLTSSALSVRHPDPGQPNSGIVLRIDAGNHTMAAFPGLLMRDPESAIFLPATPIPAESYFTAKGDDFTLLQYFTPAMPKGTYEFKVVVRDLNTNSLIESNVIAVYVGGPQAEIKILSEELEAAKAAAERKVLLEPIQIRLSSNPRLFLSVGDIYELPDGTRGEVVRKLLGDGYRLVQPGTSIPLQPGGSGIIAAGSAGNLIEVSAGGNIVGVGAASALPLTNFVITGQAGNILGTGDRNMIVAPGAGAISRGGGSAISRGGGSAISRGGGSVISRGGGALISEDSSGLVGQATASAISRGGGSIWIKQGIPAISRGGGSLQAVRQAFVAGPLQQMSAQIEEAETLAETPEGAATDATLYAHFLLWHSQLLLEAGEPNSATDTRLDLATDVLDAAAAVLDLGFEGLTPDQLAALQRAGMLMPLNIEAASPGGVIAPGSRVLLTPSNAGDSLATGSGDALAGVNLPLSLGGSVVTFGGEQGEAPQPDLEGNPIPLYGRGLGLESVRSDQIVARLPDIALIGLPQLVIVTTSDGRIALGWITVQESTGDLKFSTPNYQMPNSNGTATITVQRTGGSEGVIVYAVGTEDGSAVDGVNYTSVGGYVIFGDGDATPKSFEVPILSVSGLSGNKSVSLILANPLNVSPANPEKVATLTIGEVIPDSFDFGDAPDSYGTLLASDGARHKASGLRLGTLRDADAVAQSNANATGDDINSTDDEDGVVIPATLLTNSNATVSVTASAAGRLDAWIDFNRDGDFADAGEQIATNRALTAGTNSVTFAVPTGASVGTSFARFRLSTAGGLAAAGMANDGEVEDHQVQIATQSQTVPPQLDLGGPPVTWIKKQPAVIVLPQVSVAGTNLAGGTLAISMNAPGKKKPFDLLTVPSFSGLGTSAGLKFANGHLTLQIDLGPNAASASIQAFLRGIKFTTKGAGLKALTRQVNVALANTVGQSSLIAQTIQVRKKP